MKWKAGLVGAILLSGAALLATLVPFPDCPDCGGLLRKYGAPPGFEIDCPRCADRGRVSWLNRLTRKDLDPLVSTLVRSAAWDQTKRAASREAFGLLVERDGKQARDYLGWGESVNQSWSFAAKFARSEGREYLLVALAPWAISNKGDSLCRLVTLDLEGRILDRMEFIHSPGMGFDRCEPRLLADPGADGAWVQVEWRPGPWSGQGLEEYTVLHPSAGRSELVTESQFPADWRVRGVCRVGIRSGKLRVLSPSRAASP